MAEDRKRGAVDRINSGVDAFRKARGAYKFARTAGTAAEIVSTSEIWIPVIIIAAIILIIVFIILLGSGGTGIALQSNGGNTPGGGIPGSGGGCPDTSSNTNPAPCYLLNPSIYIFNTNISQPAIDTYINNYSHYFTDAHIGDINEFRRRVNEIRDKAVFVGLNPAIFLGYWKTESNFSTQGVRDLGCPASAVGFEAQVNCAVGLSPGTSGFIGAKCAVSRNATNQYCVGGHLISTFDDFAQEYGPFPPGSTNDNNCSHSYNGVIEVAKELGACLPSGSLDCPIPNGQVTCGSKDRPANGCGHCSEEYKRENPSLVSLCNDPDSGIQHAMDIGGLDLAPVYLPKINGHVIQWTHQGQISGSVPTEAIQRYTGVDELTHAQYFISLHHTQFGSGNEGTHIISGDVGALICGVSRVTGVSCNKRHVHVQLGLITPRGTQWFEAPDYLCKI